MTFPPRGAPAPALGVSTLPLAACSQVSLPGTREKRKREWPWSSAAGSQGGACPQAATITKWDHFGQKAVTLRRGRLGSLRNLGTQLTSPDHLTLQNQGQQSTVLVPQGQHQQQPRGKQLIRASVPPPRSLALGGDITAPAEMPRGVVGEVRRCQLLEKARALPVCTPRARLHASRSGSTSAACPPGGVSASTAGEELLPKDQVSP